MQPPADTAVNLVSDVLPDGTLKLIARGRLDFAHSGVFWQNAIEAVDAVPSNKVILDAAGVDYCDAAGIALLVHLSERQRSMGGKFEIRGLRPQFQQALNEWLVAENALPKEARVPSRRFAEEVGRAADQTWRDVLTLVTFIGELASALRSAAVKPQSIRWREVFRIAETVGVNALPIVALIGFLMGLIMAFQAAIPLGQFGAEVFVANLIGLAILRELGPLMTAIVLAGRSGSAFAAELGTMKIREELDALRTMGIQPVRFLVVPRVLAAVFMTPLLTVFADLVGVMGGSVVLLSLGFPLMTFFRQMQLAVTYGDLLGGLLKAFVFGILVAGIGCLRGLQTTTGPSAVGEATTRAVVSAIVLIVVCDGIFSVIYYYLGI